MLFSEAFRTTALMFVLVVILVFVIKPQLFFDHQGQIKSFGLQNGEHATPITLVMGIYGALFLIYCLSVYTAF